MSEALRSLSTIKLYKKEKTHSIFSAYISPFVSYKNVTNRSTHPRTLKDLRKLPKASENSRELPTTSETYRQHPTNPDSQPVSCLLAVCEPSVSRLLAVCYSFLSLYWFRSKIIFVPTPTSDSALSPICRFWHTRLQRYSPIPLASPVLPLYPV